VWAGIKLARTLKCSIWLVIIVVNEKRKLLASFDNKIVRVYQAYNDRIANEALKIGTFGNLFKKERMTWIKPSFLWMMYRSGWGTKENQERILGIDISRQGFEIILKNAVLSTFQSNIYDSFESWKEKLNVSDVRCQWDPDRDIHGNPVDRRAIQLGIKGSFVENYIKDWIVNITDLTGIITGWREDIKNNSFNEDSLPEEKEYPVDSETKNILGII
jgi:hypothetical protein